MCEGGQVNGNETMQVWKGEYNVSRCGLECGMRNRGIVSVDVCVEGRSQVWNEV